jgi:hypothetical protein
MSTDDVVKLFRELGFPAAVAAFVLWRLEARLKEVVDALTSVRLALAAMIRQGAEAARVLDKAPQPDPFTPPRPEGRNPA